MVSKLKRKSYLSTFCTSKMIGKMNRSEKIPTLMPFTLEEVRPWKLTSWKPMKSMSDIKTYVTLKLSVFLSNMTTFILLLLHPKKAQVSVLRIIWAYFRIWYIRIFDFNGIIVIIFPIDPETILGKMQTDSGLTILDHVADPKASLDTVDVNLKMPV